MSKKALVPINVLTGATEPVTPTLKAGDLFFNTDTNTLKTYNGSTWVSAGGGGGGGSESFHPFLLVGA